MSIFVYSCKGYFLKILLYLTVTPYEEWGDCMTDIINYDYLRVLQLGYHYD